MRSHQSSTKTRKRFSTPDRRLQGRWLLLARGLWGILAVFTLAIFFASLPAYIVLLHTPCSGPTCGYLQLTPEQAEALKGVGLFPGRFIVYTVALTCVLMIVCLIVSAVIVWRRTDDRMAFIVALFLVTLSPFNVMFNVSASPSPWQLPNECLNFLFTTLLPFILAVFPSGHFVPRWMHWPVFTLLILQVPFTFFPRPPALDELRLVSALREQFVQNSRGSSVQMVLEAPSSLPSLPAAVEVATYRIVLEAVTNVVRHAQAHTCQIRLEVSDELIIEVIDDGVGLPIQYHAGVGISSMHERTAELGGTCRIESHAAEGTHILVRLPLPKE